MDGNSIFANEKCDAKRDCPDGSDEKFVECYNQTCPEEQCSYGGCFKKSQLCDGNVDCWDGTDEHERKCSPEWRNYKPDNTGCKGHEFKCADNQECISPSFVCDGIKDCQDGSDETLHMCIISMCPKNTFRCKYGGCLPIEKACDTYIDCYDGSDEIYDICTKNNKYYKTKPSSLEKASGRATPIQYTPGIPPPPMKNGCNIPMSLTNLAVRTLFNVLPYEMGAEIPSTVVVRLICENNTVSIGSDLNQCLDGKWQETWPECRPSCSRTKFGNDLSIQATCDYNGQIGNCRDMDMQLLPNTYATITCSPGFKSNIENLKEIAICQRNGESATWKSQRQLKCVPDCGKIPQTVKEEPWTVSVFERHSTKHQFKHKCFGLIVSPRMVFIRFQNGFKTDNVEKFVIAEGNQTKAFDPDHEHSYNLHKVESISKSGDFTLLKLQDPFILSPSVRPICLPPFQGEYINASEYTVYTSNKIHYLNQFPREFKLLIKNDEKQN
nr:modular serine protease-like [Drosophila bipectinata]